MKYLAALLMFIASSAFAAAPSLTVTPSRTTGAAPLCVHFDATATTSDATNDFHELLHTVNFGEANAGTWANGANASASKNSHIGGPLAVHCYSATSTWTWRVCDIAGLCDQEAGTITVTAANSQWSTTKTKCVSTSGTFTDCPTGGTEVTSSNATTAVSDNIGAGDVRILFRCGETFTITTSDIALNQATGYLGTYGSCGNATLTATKGIAVSAADWRIVGLNLVGDAVDTGAVIEITGNQATISNVTISNVLRGIQADSSLPDELTIIDSTISTAAGGSPEHIVVIADKVGILGNYLDTSASVGLHLLRFGVTKKSYVAHNYFGRNDGGSVEAISIRAQNHVTAANDTQYVIVQDNSFYTTGNTSATIKRGGGAGDDAVISDIIFERNWFRFSPENVSGNYHLSATVGDKVTIRNNLCETANSLGSNGCFFVANTTDLSANPSNFWIYNNTGYSADDKNFSMIVFASDVTAMTAKNNLAYSLAVGKTVTAISDSSTGATKSNNTPDAPSTCDVLDSPSFDGPLTAPKGFRFATTSCAHNLGAAVFPATSSDGLNCANGKTGDVHIGFAVPRVRATCRGVAQQ